MINKKILSTIAALSMTASMTMPVFAAPISNTQNSEVPVVGNIGRWKDNNTNITNPTAPDSGSKGENGEVQEPNNLTDINVTVPTSMTFDVVTNTIDSNPVLASGAYQVTNNGLANVNMSGNYNVTTPGGIDLVDINSVDANAHDSKIQLGLNLNYGSDTNNTNKVFIENIKEGATSTQKVELNSQASTTLKFASTDKGLSDIKQEALAGTFANQTKVTQGNLVLTFSMS